MKGWHWLSNRKEWSDDQSQVVTVSRLSPLPSCFCSVANIRKTSDMFGPEWGQFSKTQTVKTNSSKLHCSLFWLNAKEATNYIIDIARFPPPLPPPLKCCLKICSHLDLQMGNKIPLAFSMNLKPEERVVLVTHRGSWRFTAALKLWTFTVQYVWQLNDALHFHDLPPPFQHTHMLTLFTALRCPQAACCSLMYAYYNFIFSAMMSSLPPWNWNRSSKAVESVIKTVEKWSAVILWFSLTVVLELN